DYSEHLSTHAGHQQVIGDELTRTLAVAGTAAECGRRIAGLLAAGIDGCIFPLMGSGRVERLGVLRDQLPPAAGACGRGGAARRRIAAMTAQSELERMPLPGIVAAALPHVGHFQIRSRGTVGGSLAHMDPAAEWPALAVLLDAELEVASSRGRRRIAAADF